LKPSAPIGTRRLHSWLLARSRANDRATTIRRLVGERDLSGGTEPELPARARSSGTVDDVTHSSTPRPAAAVRVAFISHRPPDVPGGRGVDANIRFPARPLERRGETRANREPPATFDAVSSSSIVLRLVSSFTVPVPRDAGVRHQEVSTRKRRPLTRAARPAASQHARAFSETGARTASRAAR